MQCIFNNQILTYIGEVAVHNAPGVPEAHRLYKSKSGFITLNINDAESLVKPIDCFHEFTDEQSINKVLAIFDVVERHYGARSIWMTKSRHRHLVYPRHLVMWAARISTNQTLHAIGKIMNFDHATVIAATKAIEGLLDCGNKEITEVALDIASKMKSHKDNRLSVKIKDIQSKSTIINKKSWIED